MEERINRLKPEAQSTRDNTKLSLQPLKSKEVRIWMDGAFDMMHYGHMNAFRQGKALGTRLIVGVNSDDTIAKCKGGKPISSDGERVAMVESCRWVDEVVSGVPYIMNDEYLVDTVLGQHRVDFVVHGDDPCLVDGKDVYESARRLGKYLTIPRTEGISTTDIVGRMLLMTKSHHGPGDEAGALVSVSEHRKSHFLTTSRIINLFAAGVQAPRPEDKIVYLAGAWDMFHAGHVDILRKAREFGSYVIVGVHNDNVVNAQHGDNFPILNLHERVLSVLGCKFVDDVLFDAPLIISEQLIVSLNVSVVVRGSSDPALDEPIPNDLDPYALPRSRGILHIVDMTRKLSGFFTLKSESSIMIMCSDGYHREDPGAA